MTTRTISLGDLMREPTAAVPFGHLATSEHDDPLGEPHAARLLAWAGITLLSVDTGIQIESYVGSGSGGPGRLPSVSPTTSPMIEPLRWPEHWRSQSKYTGWTLIVTTPGRPSRRVRLSFEGAVIDHGTAAHQEADRVAEEKRRTDAERERFEAEGRGRLWELQAATRAREVAEREQAGADSRWQDAIRAAVEGGDSVSEVARLAKVSASRVYQVRDGRR